MFGTIFRARPKQGKTDEIFKLMEEEGSARMRSVKGFRVSYTLQESNGVVWGVAVFDDEATYRANASDPEQDKWYQKFRALLEADPEWHDGTIRAFSVEPVAGRS